MKRILPFILLSPDAAEGVEQDPLSVAAGGVDTTFPLLAPDRTCRFRIKSAKNNIVKDDLDRDIPASEKRRTLALQLVTEQDYTDVDGKPLRKGFPVFKYIGLTPSEADGDKRARTWDDIKRDLAILQKAVGFQDKTIRSIVDNPSQLEGQIVDCRVGIDKARDGWEAKNNVKFVIPA